MRRKVGGAKEAANAPTYQDVLDEAIEETFPASDPIAPAVANAGEPVSTRKNPTDWKLEHGAGAEPRHSTLAGEAVQPRAAAGLDAIYRALKRGVGREQVNDTNVDSLIGLARERGDTQLEILLREWRSSCGDDPDMPTNS